MINYEVRYRSKKKKPRPKKANHRHEFEPCIIKYFNIAENADSLAELIMHLVHAVEFAVG